MSTASVLKVFQHFIKFLQASFSSVENSVHFFLLIMPINDTDMCRMILICFPTGSVCNMVSTI